MEDPRRLAALHYLEELDDARKLVDLSANVEVQLRMPEDWTPVMAILSRAQDEAAEAIIALTKAPIERPDVIRGLQNQVWRYERLVTWLREIVVEGREASLTIDQNKAELMRDLIMDDETRSAVGLTEPGAGTE